MCRSIKRLNIKNQKVTEDEIYQAARQYVRKVSGFREPSKKNTEAFEKAIEQVCKTTKLLLENLASN